MLSNERIAHDLALIWVNNTLTGRLPQLTEGKHLVDEYFAAYAKAMKKLETLEGKESAHIDQP